MLGNFYDKWYGNVSRFPKYNFDAFYPQKIPWRIKYREPVLEWHRNWLGGTIVGKWTGTGQPWRFLGSENWTVTLAEQEETDEQDGNILQGMVPVCRGQWDQCRNWRSCASDWRCGMYHLWKWRRDFERHLNSSKQVIAMIMMDAMPVAEWIWGNEGNPQKPPWTGSRSDHCYDRQWFQIFMIGSRYECTRFKTGWDEGTGNIDQYKIRRCDICSVLWFCHG